MNDIVVNLDAPEIVADLNSGLIRITPEQYTGAVTVTPTRERQTLPTAAQYLDRNVTVEPIPACYGLITYNGAGITVS